MRILKSATEMLGGNDFTFCVKKVLDRMCPEELESVASTATKMPSITRLERQLTKHIATRWYRAPEVLIMDVSAGRASEA